jgi:hypothetical protein
MELRSLYWGWGGSQEWAAALLGSHTPLEKSAPGFKNARLPIPATPIPPRLDLSRSGGLACSKTR